MKPWTLTRTGVLQLSYDLPKRQTSSLLYNRQTPNGLSIIICGSETGLEVLWSGGRALDVTSSTALVPNTHGPETHDLRNGSEGQHDEISNTQLRDNVPEEEEEVERDGQYRRISYTTSINLGSSVVRIAQPPLPSGSKSLPDGAYPPILSTHAVVLLACTDGSAKLISLPLQPSPLTADSFQCIELTSSNSAKDVPLAVALSVTAVWSDSSTGDDHDRSRSRGRMQSDTDAVVTPLNWSFTAASILPSVGGQLLIHQIPIMDNETLSSTPEHSLPMQQQHLRVSSPHMSMHFNPGTYPSNRHTNLVISSGECGWAKIYQIYAETSSGRSRNRRTSVATIDSTNSGPRSVHGPFSSRGRFLLTLHTSFHRGSDSDQLPRRKKILDCTWVLNGRAVMALLENGEWGIWDIEGTEATSNSATLFQGQQSASGIRGGSVTPFNFTSSVVSRTDESKSRARQSSSQNSLLAPMTPHTRKAKSKDFFETGKSSQSAPATRGFHTNGRINVRRSVISGSNATSEESIILAYGASNIYISSLSGLLRAEGTHKGSFDAVAMIRPMTLPLAVLGGNAQISIFEIPRHDDKRSPGLFARSTNIIPDVFIATAHQVIMLVRPHAGDFIADSHGSNKILIRSSTADQLLLERQELDVDGMDRLLNSMEDVQQSTMHATDLRKSVAFADADDDVDMGFGTPAPKQTRPRFMDVKGTPLPVKHKMRQSQGRNFT